ncbi:MAG: signal peptidase I [Eubacteriales bacterium]
MNPNTTSEVPAEPSKSSFTLSCYEWVEALIPALVIIIVIFTFLFRVITINGPSMMPNLKNGYKVLVSCTDRKFTRGDIVVVDRRATSLDETLIKRVIATEGQTVDIDFNTGVVSVNGVPLDESAYIENGITKNQYDISFPQTVPPGHIFVLGDNRTISDDSRSSDVGMIDQRYIIGKVQLILMKTEKPNKL